MSFLLLIRSLNIIVALVLLLSLRSIGFVCYFGFKFSKALNCFPLDLQLSLFVFPKPKAFPKGEVVNLVCSIIFC